MPSGTNAKPGVLARHVAEEVRAELARQGLPMSALAGVMPGKAGYVKDRLGVNARYALNLNDLMGIEELLHVSPVEFIERAAANVRADTMAVAERNAAALQALEDQAVARLTEDDDTPGSNLHPFDTP